MGKHEIRSSKYETNSKLEFVNDRNSERFGCLVIRILDLFRISSFVFRIFLIPGLEQFAPGGLYSFALPHPASVGLLTYESSCQRQADL